MHWRRYEERSHLLRISCSSAKCSRCRFLTTTSEFVVDLLLEKNHVLSSELTENAQDALTTQKTIEASMGIGIVLCAAEDPFAFGIDFLQPG